MKSAESAGSTLQVCRACGAGAPLDAHFCPECSKILPMTERGDYFSFMGLQRRLGIDAGAIDRRFRELSRQFHPDYFCNAPPAERRASLERSSYLNDAYRVLKSPIARIGYLLQIEGALNSDASTAPPAALLEEVFALNEELDEIRQLRASSVSPSEWLGRLERARLPIEAKRARHEAELEVLSKRWDDAVRSGLSGERFAILPALRERFLERNYISNLLAGIERELAG